MNQIKGVLVVGGSGEIGSEICRELSRMGFSVGIHYVKNKKQAQKLSQEKHSYASFKIFQSNLTTSRDVQKLVRDFVKWSRRPAGIVLAGGEIPHKSWQNLTKQDWEKVLRQHCIVPYELIRTLSPNLSKNSRIVYLSSISPKYGGSQKTLHYACAKSAGETAVLGLAHRLRSKGILLNTVRAGFIETKSQTENRSSIFRQNRIKQIYLRRAGSPEEIGYVVASLFQKKASFFANTIITAAGGD